MRYAHRQMQAERLDFQDPFITARIRFWRGNSYGFARAADGTDYFIAQRALPGGLKSLTLGTVIRFLAFQGRDLQAKQAYQITIL
jgi:hypothetical protein